MAVTVLCEGVPVYSDPLSRTLFGGEIPTLPPSGKGGRLVTGNTPYLLFCHDQILDGTLYTVCLCLPVKEEEAQNENCLAALSEEIAPAFFARFSRLFDEKRAAHPTQTLPVLYFFRTLTEQICTTLYAPLTAEVAGGVDNGSVHADGTLLSRAVGLALFALLQEGQSTLCARLSGGDALYTLSLVGERGVDNPFIRRILNILASRGGFSIRHTANGVRFLLLAAHAPAALLRDEPENVGACLCDGFFLLS